MKRARRSLLFTLTVSILLCLVQFAPAQAAGGGLQGAGTETMPFQISNEEQLRMLGDFPNAYWILTDNVVLTSQWTPVVKFTGNLDGNGYTISGLEIYDKEDYDPNEAAFIKENTGTIKNLHLEGQATFESCQLGGAMLVFENSGTIENCSVKGTIHLVMHNTHTQGHSDCGGMVSFNTSSGVIRNSYARLLFTFSIESGNRSYGYYTACFAQRNYGTIENCYSASEGEYSYHEFWGFTRWIGTSTAQYESCYYDKDLPGIYSWESDEFYQMFPRTTTAMKMQSNYTGWDFEQVWAMDENVNDGYPYLRNEKSVTIHAAGLALDPAEATVQEGETITLRPVFTPQGTTNQTVTWRSSNESTATVENGVVTGVSEGTVAIIATSEDGGFTATCQVTVTAEPVEPQNPGGACGADLTWTLMDGKLTISGTGAMSYDGYEAPWIEYGDEITEIEIGSGVTALADYAFAYTNITELFVPASVTEIGAEAMGSCTALEAITIDAANPAYSARDGVLFSKDQTVLIQYPAGKPDPAYYVPDGVERILESAIYLNDQLKDVYIPDSVTDIEYYAISTYNALTVHGTAGGTAEAYVENFNKSAIIELKFEPVSAAGYDYTVSSVSGSPSAGGKFRASVSVTKNTDTDQGIIILALYSREGALSDFIFMQGDFEQGKTYTFGGTLTGFEGAVLKAFVWDNFTTMVPISNTAGSAAE